MSLSLNYQYSKRRKTMMNKIEKPFNYKVNYYFIETCDMSCKYFFAKMMEKK